MNETRKTERAVIAADHKKNQKIRPFGFVAVFMAVLLLPLFAACGRDANGKNGTDTVTPAVTEISGVPDDNDSGETSADIPADLTDPLLTEGENSPLSPAKYGKTYTVMCNSGSADIINMSAVSGLMRERYGVELTLRGSTDICSEVSQMVRSGLISSIDLLMPTAEEGVRLMISGCLDDVSEAGIGINSGTPGVNGPLTDSCALGGRRYLLFGDALTSDIFATYGVLFRSKLANADFGYDPAALALSGEFDAQNFIICSNYAGVYAKLTGGNGMTVTGGVRGKNALLAGLGGRIFTSDPQGLPELSSLSPSSTLASAYSDALNILSHADKEITGVPSVMEVTTLRAVGEGEIFLPMPCRTGEKYISYVELSRCSVLALPCGVANGSKAAALIRAVLDCGKEKRQITSGTVCGGKTDGDEAALVDIILGAQTADPAVMFGWGDFDTLFGEGLEAGTSYAGLMKEKTLSDRQNALKTAVSIVAQRLKITK
ncbi:MAG: hypothetical protein MJ102_04515 [Clostridia bacterium]|nr:hypothetical protein [Clostridia bacterium]